MNELENREEWLVNVGQYMAETILHGVPVPDDWRVSCGWAPGSRKNTLGVCLMRSESEAGVNEIFISPHISDSLTAAGILLHELIHAADDGKSGHRGDFAKWARMAGFRSPLTELNPSETLKMHLEEVVSVWGDYPHAAIVRRDVKKQSTRMLKVECKDCGVVWRASRASLRTIRDGHCLCPACLSADMLVNGEPILGADLS